MKNLLHIDSSGNRIFGLDLMRFIAIITVLISHSITVLPARFHKVHNFIFDGVLIFFVLSGFLIGRIFIRDFQNECNTVKIVYFWKRRWFRTLPAYYFTVILLFCLSYFAGRQVDISDLFKSFLFIQNIYYHSGHFFPESWSLAIEEWFYLLLPILFLIFQKFLKKNTRVSILFVFIFISLVSVVIRIFVFIRTDVSSIAEWDQNFRSPVITRLDSILMGVLGAWFYIFKIDYFKKYKNIFFIIGVSIFFFNKLYLDYYIESFNNFYMCVWYFSIVPASIFLMIPKFYYMKPSRFHTLNTVIVKGSLISYSMYLINLSIISFIVLHNLRINYWWKFSLFWVLTVIGSILMYKYIEIPLMKLRDKS